MVSKDMSKAQTNFHRPFLVLLKKTEASTLFFSQPPRLFRLHRLIVFFAQAGLSLESVRVAASRTDLAAPLLPR